LDKINGDVGARVFVKKIFQLPQITRGNYKSASLAKSNYADVQN